MQPKEVTVLLRFRVSNHASIHAPQELSLIADKSFDERAEQAVPRSRYRTVPSAAIYGSNASGKSNLIDAIIWMKSAVLHSFASWDPVLADTAEPRRRRAVPRRPFAFTEDPASRPSEYAVDFVFDGVRYEYGFSCDDDRVLTEWLVSYEEGPARRLFHRTTDDDTPIRFGRHFKGPKKSSTDMLRENSLYLSVAAASNHPVLRKIYTWFSEQLLVATDYDFPSRLDFTLSYFHQDDWQATFLADLLGLADLGIDHLDFKERTPDPQSERFRERLYDLIEEETGSKLSLPDSDRYEIRTSHRAGGKEFLLRLGEESHGTQTWIGMLGPVLNALYTGAALCVDELDAHLHPTLTDTIVDLFQDPSTNPNGAQLIFNSHATGLLGSSTQTWLRRDQIWFTEKDMETGATVLYPMTDFDTRDTGVNLERRYLAGRFGGLPLIRESLRSELANEIQRRTRAAEQRQSEQARQGT
jgi:hypothetical protein